MEKASRRIASGDEAVNVGEAQVFAVLGATRGGSVTQLLVEGVQVGLLNRQDDLRLPEIEHETSAETAGRHGSEHRQRDAKVLSSMRRHVLRAWRLQAHGRVWSSEHGSDESRRPKLADRPLRARASRSDRAPQTANRARRGRAATRASWGNTARRCRRESARC